MQSYGVCSAQADHTRSEETTGRCCPWPLLTHRYEMVDSICEVSAVLPVLFHLTFMRCLGDKGQPKSTSQRFIFTYNALPHGCSAQTIQSPLSFPMTITFSKMGWHVLRRCTCTTGGHGSWFPRGLCEFRRHDPHVHLSRIIQIIQGVHGRDVCRGEPACLSREG